MNTDNNAALEGPVADAERSVLAAMLLGSESVGRAVGMIDASAFYRSAHQKIFSAIAALHGRGESADSITATEELRKRGDLESAGGVGALAHILEYATTTANLAEHVKIVRGAARKRELLSLAADLEQRARDPGQSADAIAAAVLPKIEELHRQRSGSSRFIDAALDATSFLKLELPPARSLLGDGVLTAGGFGILYGQPGLGKTWLELELALAVARGLPWMGLATPAEGCRVGILQLELSAQSIQKRLGILGIGTHPRDSNIKLIARPRLRGSVNLLQPEDFAALRAWIEADNLAMLIIDALSRAHTANENVAHEFGPVLSEIDVVRHETGCAIVPIHHEPKIQVGKVMGDLDALRGTSRLQSDPTLAIRFKTHRGLRCMVFAKVSEGETPAPVYFNSEGRPIACDPPGDVASNNREKILRVVLGSSSPMSRDEVESASGLSKATVARHLNSLATERKVVSSGSAQSVRYRKPPDAASGSSQSSQSSQDPPETMLTGINGSGLDPAAYYHRSSHLKTIVSSSQSSPLKGDEVLRRSQETITPRHHPPTPALPRTPITAAEKVQVGSRWDTETATADGGVR